MFLKSAEETLFCRGFSQDADSPLSLPPKQIENEVHARDSKIQSNLSPAVRTKAVPLMTRRFSIKEKIKMLDKAKELNNNISVK